MKIFVEITAAIKSFAAMIFAGLLIVYTVFGGFFGLSYVPFSLVWQALFVSAVASVLHFLAFSDAGLKKASYAGRLIFFGLTLLIILSGFACLFNWFDIEKIMNWLAFTAVYTFFFGIVTLVFKLYTKVTAKKYTEILDAYKRKYQI